MYDPVKIIRKGDFYNLKGNIVEIRPTKGDDKNAGKKEVLIDIVSNGMVIINQLKEKGHRFENPFSSRITKQNFRSSNRGSNTVGINETCMWSNENSVAYNKR